MPVISVTIFSEEAASKAKSSPSISEAVNKIIKLSPSLESFGATIDPSFGNLFEICIMITIKDVYPKYLERYQLYI